MPRGMFDDKKMKFTPGQLKLLKKLSPQQIRDKTGLNIAQAYDMLENVPRDYRASTLSLIAQAVDLTTAEFLNVK